MRKFLRAPAIGALACLSLLGCDESGGAQPFEIRDASTSAPAPTPNADKPAPHAYALRVLALTNEQRADSGLAALSWNDALAQSAQGYAEWMARDGFFDHTGPDGSSPGDRISDAGYDWQTYGENIAYGYATPDAVMQGWMNSSGHRAAILSSGYRDLGVGYAVSKGGTAYWVQNFGRR